MKITVDVTQTVEVTLDETKFTPEFLAAFREDFYNFTTTAQHAEHLAQLFARGLFHSNRPGETGFIEGYGFDPESKFGIGFKLLDQREEIA